MGAWYSGLTASLGLRGARGLPYGKVGLRRKAWLVSAEKASRSASIDACISGIGQAEVQFSRSCM